MYRRLAGVSVLFSMLLLAFACGRADEASPASRTYRLTDRDALALLLPHDWNDDVRSIPGEPFPSIFLAPKGGDAGGIVLTVMGRSGPGSGGPTEEQLKQAVEDAAAEMGSPELVAVRGEKCRGWLATETAEGRPPDSHGILVVGEMVVTVAVQGGDAMRDHAVALLETAEHQRPELRP